MIERVDFIGIGAAKCGTTLLAHALSRHPNVVFPNIFSHKEADFFTDRHGNYTRGIEWYFERFQKHGHGKCYGEFSPSYFSDPNSPIYIRRHAPDVKLICMLRDPVKRAFSWFLQCKKACRIPNNLSFRDAVSTNPDILRDSYYSEHLSRYLEYFPASQLYVLFLEDLIAHPEETCRRLLDVLALPDFDLAAYTQDSVNQAWQPRSPTFHRLMWNIRNVAKSAGLQFIVHALRRLGPGEWIYNLNKGAADTLGEAEHEQIAELFESDTEQLCQLLKRTTLPWTGKPNQEVGRAA